MAFINTPDDYIFPWYVRVMFWMQRRHYGETLAPARLWARLPASFLGLSILYASLDRRMARVDPALRTLVQVRVSQINVCPYCIDFNAAQALARGVGADKLEALATFRDSPLFTPRARAALEFAECVTRTGEQLDETLIARLREHFSDDAIVELTALVAFQNLSSKFNAALGVPAQGFCAPRSDVTPFARSIS